ncbi:Uncharacterised protein [Ewingella americana]|uniref:Uncharacterized protein n=1 Tax=Ewingella americana TaxID=41202 RepID=A0A377NJL7_9GAMM|nr:Uncharacterised protein [Ewingella americana]
MLQDLILITKGGFRNNFHFFYFDLSLSNFAFVLFH